MFFLCRLSDSGSTADTCAGICGTHVTGSSVSVVGISTVGVSTVISTVISTVGVAVGIGLCGNGSGHAGSAVGIIVIVAAAGHKAHGHSRHESCGNYSSLKLLHKFLLLTNICIHRCGCF